MCLVSIALDLSSRFPFVLAGNRDEFMARPSARLGWWEAPGQPAILSGRDLQAGGTWLGLTASGRLAVLTNVRDPAREDKDAPSRGEIVPLWLKGHKPMQELWPQLAMSGYNGFNLVALDFAQGECFWVSNTARHPQRLERGLYGLSNAHLNTPWPKVAQIKARTKAAVAQSATADELAMHLFEALADPTLAPDDDLPYTGVSPEWEKLLSAAFVRSPDGSYGTRCSTLVITERVNKRLVTHVMERTYTSGTRMALLRRVSLKNWPPRHTTSQDQLARLDQTLPPAMLHQEDRFESSDVHEQDNHALSAPPAAKKTRARSLIKPTGAARRGP
jgi:uncharacterized protein with NRDE domain